MRKFYNLAGILTLSEEEKELIKQPLDDEDEGPDDDGRFDAWS